MKIEFNEDFPLSKNKHIKGTRRLAREKVLQILFANAMCETDVEQLFHHIFYREFNLNEDVIKQDKFLRPEEVVEMEADFAVKWKNDEIEFGKLLTKYTISNSKLIDEMLEDISENWEINRIALIDKLLIHMAVTELISFPEIPPKVSINEVIDIAKKYSTDKSYNFINGVLDAMLAKVKSKGLLTKEGRGLKDF